MYKISTIHNTLNNIPYIITLQLIGQTAHVWLPTLTCMALTLLGPSVSLVTGGGVVLSRVVDKCKHMGNNYAITMETKVNCLTSMNIVIELTRKAELAHNSN